MDFIADILDSPLLTCDKQKEFRKVLTLLSILDSLDHVQQLEDKRVCCPDGIRYSLIQRIPKQVEYLNKLCLGNDIDCFDNLRMTKEAFYRLCIVLRVGQMVCDDVYVNAEEKIAMFFKIVGHNHKFRTVRYDFNRSSRTIFKSFHEVLNTVVKLKLFVQPVPVPEDLTDERWGLSGGSGRYICPRACTNKKIPRFRTRKGQIVVNVPGVCDRDGRFVYVLSGWEGSAADARVLKDALSRPDGLKVPQGTYYLADNGYMNCEGFLIPYRCTRYHPREWTTGNRAPQNAKEYFNLKHSKARNVIERTFGILKRRWAVLRSLMYYSIRCQIKVIYACAILHNFLKENQHHDLLEEFEDEPVTLSQSPTDFPIEYVVSLEPSPAWTQKRDEMATSMFARYRNISQGEDS